MNRTRIAELALCATALFSGAASAEPAAPRALGPAQTAAGAAEPEREPDWAFSALGYLYVVPGDADYVQPSVSADHDVLHLEARYNYEDRFTASLWAGYTFSGGDELTWEIAPMFGGVFGGTSGVAPGYRGSLGYWKLELYSESEYLFDFDEPSASFFFNWSELTVAPVEWFRVGLVIQRTRAYESERDFQRGGLLGFSYEFASVSVYLFNPDDERPTLVVGAALSFDCTTEGAP